MTSTAGSAPSQSYIILAALSLDETGELALREAARVAQQRPDSELHLVHVVIEEAPATSASELASLDQRLANAPAKIREYVEQIWADIPSKVVAHLRAGQPSRSILQAAVDINADVIVVGSHRRAGLKKLMLGSVAEQVLQHAHCPVLVALPKDYSGKTHSDVIQPPCSDCVQLRTATNGEQYWCERHSRTYHKPHVYEPSDAQHRTSSVMPTR
jgi:nucleotide-binding universal stress UspA family protein